MDDRPRKMSAELLCERGNIRLEVDLDLHLVTITRWLEGQDEPTRREISLDGP